MSRLKYKDANGNWQYATSYHQVTNLGGVTPEGTISITKNGTHDVTNYASAEVDVPVGVFPTGTLEITENGVHDVYNKMAVNVNVPTGGGEMEQILVQDNASYAFAGSAIGHTINAYPNLYKTNLIYDASNMFFKNATVKKIPFTINFNESSGQASVKGMFSFATNLQEPPAMSAVKITDCGDWFKDCYKIDFSGENENWGSNLDFSYLTTNAYATCSSMFANCSSARKFPQPVLKGAFSGCGTSNNYVGYYYGFQGCYNVDEILNLGVNCASLTSNRFGYIFDSCYCLKRVTFETNADGSPKVAKWKSQVIDLTKVGYCLPTYSWYLDNIATYCPERQGKRIYDNETYALYKNDPDAYTGDNTANNQCQFWSLYNKVSAIETINSLPDCSATGANVIKFKNDAGMNTDGGAMYELTEEEIAVASAKGWTVTLT